MKKEVYLNTRHKMEPYMSPSWTVKSTQMGSDTRMADSDTLPRVDVDILREGHDAFKLGRLILKVGTDTSLGGS